MLKNEIAREVQTAIAKTIADGHWQLYQGPNAALLEQRLSDLAGQTHTQLTSSGTAAMEMVLRAAGIGPKDEVLLSGYDYPGNFWAIERVGARPVLVDTVPNSWRIAMDSLDEMFQVTCKALIVSHLHGELQAVDQLRAWCDKRNILMIEDTCQALGAICQNRPAGSHGHASVFSFGGGKLMSCGRGGAWATSDELLAIKARVASGAGSGPYAMSDLQATAVLAQLRWLDEINLVCRDYFAALDQQLSAKTCNWHFVPRDHLESTAFYQCGWLLPKSFTGQARQNLISAIQNGPPANEESLAEKLPVGTGFSGFHRRSIRRCRSAQALDNAKEAAEHTLVIHHSLVLQERWKPAEIADWILACLLSIE